jgi:protein-disulfide isomerase
MKFTSTLSLLTVSLLAFGVSGVQAEPAKKASGFEAQIEKYLQTEQGQIAVGKAAESYFKQRQELAKKEEEEKQKADFENQFKNPVKIDIGSSPVKGPENAKITIIEFSDFQCPFCKRGHDVIEEVLKAYPQEVKVAFKQLPLPFHQFAMPAAKASAAAARQGKFWEMYSKLFENQSKLNAEYFEVAAKELGLDVEKFKTDSADPAIEAQIKADMAVAEANGIQGTPGFFVNGVAVKGAYPVEHFKMIIDRHLGKTAAKGK